ncbi:hypothetical protein PM082_009972 [Marasmius tenuissimus]|nr:hypothetical protein PM082_009972 [Marasmius tenuissimus]
MQCSNSSADATKRRLSVASILNGVDSRNPAVHTTSDRGIDHHQYRDPTTAHLSPSQQYTTSTFPYLANHPGSRFQSRPPPQTPIFSGSFGPQSRHQVGPATRVPGSSGASYPDVPEVSQAREGVSPLQSWDESITLDCGPPLSPLSSRRAPLTSESQRRTLFENDPWIERSRLTPHAVVCKGCGRTLALDKNPTRKYYTGHWKHHRSRCIAISIKKEAMNLPQVINIFQKPLKLLTHGCFDVQEDGYWDLVPN